MVIALMALVVWVVNLIVERATREHQKQQNRKD